MSTRKFALTAAVLLSGSLATGAAQAGPQVEWQVRVETPVLRLPGHVVLPLPPILVPRAVVVTPQRDERAYPEPRRSWDGDDSPRRSGGRARWDRDGDGIPNRYDAYPDDARNGRGWRGHDGGRRDEARRDERDDGRRDWRHEPHRH